jgi:hypothetical protein
MTCRLWKAESGVTELSASGTDRLRVMQPSSAGVVGGPSSCMAAGSVQGGQLRAPGSLVLVHVGEWRHGAHRNSLLRPPATRDAVQRVHSDVPQLCTHD